MAHQDYQPGDEWQIGHTAADIDHLPIKRVAIITEAFLPKMDGVTKLATLTARYHLNMGREIIIYAPSLRIGPHTTPDTLDGCRVVSVPSWRLWFFPAESRGGIPYVRLQALYDFKPDLVHLFSPALLAWSGIHYARQHNIPVIANYQTDLPGYTRRYGVGALERPAWAYLRHLHSKATLTLAPTETNLCELEEHGFARLRLWWRGCDTRRFHPDKRSAAMRRRLLNGKPENSFLVVYVGRLANEKRVDLLREVAKLDGVAVAIVGSGPKRADLERLFNGTAYFTGFLSGEDLAQAYASADLFSFTGVNEVAGQVVKEAMASGLPVLVPNSGGIIDYVTDSVNGCICQPDPQDYKRKVLHIRDHPEQRAVMAHNALAYVRQLSWEKTMAELERFYAEAYHIHRRQRLVRAQVRARLRPAALTYLANRHR
ncbi:MAG: glycosyltransferase family 1 protein [Anaerolineae bacterium]|nr:glycosyltransferase family 1 protein [Anaerolineae bacterium]